ncbi:hypothetical protein KEM52_004495 [Ascosphaera acerosa]|nr:hypothetical protein KEM52_004495 [Ascosphaera acerosa]
MLALGQEALAVTASDSAASPAHTPPSTAVLPSPPPSPPGRPSATPPTVTAPPVVCSPQIGHISWHPTDPAGKPIHQTPWMKPIRSALHFRDNAFGRLHQELASYAKYMRQSFQERQARLVVGEHVQRILNQAPGLAGHVKISHNLDLAVPHAPLMFFTKINTPHGTSEVFHKRRNFIRNLRLQAVENALLALNVAAVSHHGQQQAAEDVFVKEDEASSDFSALSLRHTPTGLRVIVHADRWNVDPARADVVKRYLDKYPHLETIYIALRMLLEIHELLYDGYTGLEVNEHDDVGDAGDGIAGVNGSQVGAEKPTRGIDPYTLILLIVGALRQSKPEGSYSKTDASVPFLDVLNWLATWDMRKYGMTINNPKLFELGSSKDPFTPSQPSSQSRKGRAQQQAALEAPPQRPPRRICVQDVVDEWRNVGKYIDVAGEFQDLCRVAFLDISSQMEAWQKQGQKSLLNKQGKVVERPVLLRAWAANYKSLRSARARLVRGSFPIADALEAEDRAAEQDNKPPTPRHTAKTATPTIQMQSVEQWKRAARAVVDRSTGRRGKEVAATPVSASDEEGTPPSTPLRWRINRWHSPRLS